MHSSPKFARLYVSSPSKNRKYTAADADGALRRFFTIRQYVYHMSNKYLFGLGQDRKVWDKGWESDFVTMIKKSQNFSEVEIKVAKADFYKDFEKPKHKILDQVHKDGSAIISEKTILPHRFYFCFPEGMIPDTDVPEYAGILHIVHGYIRYSLTGPVIREIRRGPLLHKQPLFEKIRQELLDKFFYETFNTRMKNDYRRLHELNKKGSQTQ